MFGGNSNGARPIWMPVNVLAYPGLAGLSHLLRNDFQIECPTGSGHMMNLYEVAHERRALTSIFLPDQKATGRVRRHRRFQHDPHWRLLLFYEYFHGDNGAAWAQSSDRLDRHSRPAHAPTAAVTGTTC